MILIFTREEGKLSAGTHISEMSRSRAALAIRPFAYGQYFLVEKNADLRSISSAEIIDAHFALGEDADRFAEASYVLELTDKLLPDGVRAPQVFDLLREYLAMLTGRKSDFRLLTISFMVKALREFGVFPDTASLAEGELISGLNGDILDVLAFITEQPLSRMDALTLEEEKERAIFGVAKLYAYDYLDLGTIKSERMLAQGSVSTMNNEGGCHGNHT